MNISPQKNQRCSPNIIESIHNKKKTYKLPEFLLKKFQKQLLKEHQPLKLNMDQKKIQVPSSENMCIKSPLKQQSQQYLKDNMNLCMVKNPNKNQQVYSIEKKRRQIRIQPKKRSIRKGFLNLQKNDKISIQKQNSSKPPTFLQNISLKKLQQFAKQNESIRDTQGGTNSSAYRNNLAESIGQFQVQVPKQQDMMKPYQLVRRCRHIGQSVYKDDNQKNAGIQLTQQKNMKQNNYFIKVDQVSFSKNNRNIYIPTNKKNQASITKKQRIKKQILPKMLYLNQRLSPLKRVK